MPNDNMIPNLRAVRNEADAAAVRAAPAVADEAALAGKPTGQYELTATSELVAWNGAGVTARGPMPASMRQLQARRTDLSANYNAGAATRLITDAGTYEVLPDASAPAANGRDVVQLAAGKRAVWHKRKIHDVNLTEFAGIRGDNNTDISDALTDALRLLALDGAGPVGKIYMPQQTVPGNPPQAFLGQSVDLNLAVTDNPRAYRVDLDLGSLRLAPGVNINIRNGWRNRINAYLTGGGVGDWGIILKNLRLPVVSVEAHAYAGTALVLPGSRKNGDLCELVTVERLAAYDGGRSLWWGASEGGSDMYSDAQGKILSLKEVGMQAGPLLQRVRDLTLDYYENYQGTSGAEGITVTDAGAIHIGKYLAGDEGTLMAFNGNSTKITVQEAYLTGGDKRHARGVYIGPQVYGLHFETLMAEGLDTAIEAVNGARYSIAAYLTDGNNNRDFRWNSGADNLTLSPKVVHHGISFPNGPHFTRPVQITPSASPMVYTNNTARQQRVYVSGGAVTQVEITHLAVKYTAGLGPGAYDLAPGDALTLQYTAVPTVWVQQL